MTKLRLNSLDSVYQYFVQPILQKDDGLDPERLSQIALSILGQTSRFRKSSIMSNIIESWKTELQRKDARLEQRLFGCVFNNPVGLAAGFDKNGIAAGIWDYFGFGFAELGTVTWHPQPGNPKPRLFRLSSEQAALNRMGFNNDGARKMAKTLEQQRLKKVGTRPVILGLNCGKSKITPLNQAANDYSASVQALGHLADYAVINVSSPNTPGLRSLQDTKELLQLIQALKELSFCPPLLVKIAPDLEDKSIDEIAKLACEEELAGIIAVNTSLNRFGLENRKIIQTGLTLEAEAGGLSGSPLRTRATDVIRRLRKAAGPNLPLIGVGGIDSAETAWERITVGASLVQIYTGWIYQGPGLVPRILDGLLCQLNRHGFRNISEAVGSNVPWHKQ